MAREHLDDEQTRDHRKSFFESLTEKDRRRFAAVESERMGHGGIQRVADMLGGSTRTISRGLAELDSLADDPAAGGESPDRDTQFVNIAALIEQYRQAGNPCFSVDTKAKEFQGQLFRKGRVRCSRVFEAFDHDFPSSAEGVIIPHGIYDPLRSRGHINIGLSRDTTEFACDSLLWYWNRIGRQCDPDAESILRLVDGGGSNSATKHLFKHDLQEVVNTIGIDIRVAHYPSYCSKYNLIESRFFPHITRACTGLLFDTLERAAELIRKATTSSSPNGTTPSPRIPDSKLSNDP